MISKLFVGDVCNSLAQTAQSYNSQAQLINHDNFDSFRLSGWSAQVYYTSLGDLSMNLLVQCLDQAKSIHLVVPESWSNSDLKNLTLELLKKYNVENLLPEPDLTVRDQAMLSVVDQRSSSAPHLFVAGCSISYGLALDSPAQKYGCLMAKEMNLPLVNLNRSATSVSWAAEQILRSDFTNQDTLVWLITGINRVTWAFPSFYSETTKIDDLEYVGITPKYVGKDLNSIERKFFDYYLTSDEQLLSATVRSIQSVINFCRYTKTKFVFGFIPTSYPHQLSAVKRIFKNQKEFADINWKLTPEQTAPWADLANDNSHPGPVTHQHIAKSFLQHLKNY